MYSTLLSLYEAELGAQSQAVRQAVIDQAVTNLQRRGIQPPAPVLTLYANYVAGSLTWSELLSSLRARTGVVTLSLPDLGTPNPPALLSPEAA